MKARSTVLLLAFAMALVACDSAPPTDDTLQLAVVATSSSAAPLDAAAAFDPDLDLQAWSPEPTVLADLTSDLEPIEPEPLSMSVQLRHGETLHHFARWAGLPVETIAEASGLDLSGSYVAGVNVTIPVDSEETMTVITTAREGHHTRRAEGYLASRGGAIGVEVVTVHTGDSATSIAREQMGIPLWLLQTYNPATNLDRLRPGQDLLVPILADIVVDALDLPD